MKIIENGMAKIKFDNMIDACFLPTNEFQLFTAITIVIGNQFNADLLLPAGIVTEDKNHNKRIIDVVKQKNIFRTVVDIADNKLTFKNVRFRLLRYAKKLYLLFFLDKKAGELLDKSVCYKRFCRTTRSYPILFLLIYFYKYCPETKICYYDDGEGSYDTDELCFLKGKLRFLFHLVTGKSIKKIKQYWYLYSPELYRKLNPDSDVQIEKIPYIWDKPEMQTMAKDIFGVTESELQTNDVVLLDTVHNEVFQDAGEQEISIIYEKIFTCFGKEKVLIKRHPRDTFTGYEGCKYSTQTSAPFEVLAMDVDMNQKLLIGFGSTSFVTSKIMKDEEPYVLLLYKLVNKNNKKISGSENRSDRYYHAVKEMYRNPEKFMIPETMEELDECLQKLKAIYVK